MNAQSYAYGVLFFDVGHAHVFGHEEQNGDEHNGAAQTELHHVGRQGQAEQGSDYGAA